MVHELGGQEKTCLTIDRISVNVFRFLRSSKWYQLAPHQMHRPWMWSNKKKCFRNRKPAVHTSANSVSVVFVKDSTINSFYCASTWFPILARNHCSIIQSMAEWAGTCSHTFIKHQSSRHQCCTKRHFSIPFVHGSIHAGEAESFFSMSAIPFRGGWLHVNFPFHPIYWE